jgi:type IV pilus assembly protein PilY1
VVIYGGTDSAPDSTIFFGDNQGFLHAINGKDGIQSGYGNSEGEEYFSFIPVDLLKNQKALYDNSQVSPHPYGLDGAITTWVHDDNGNNQLYDSGDFVYLYTGMRRGGKDYYALDVTDRTNPKSLWGIKGGPSGDAGFEELGQTWSRPVKTKIQVNNIVKEVLIFSGGYDENQDDVNVRTVDSMGRAIYIVDALDGTIIWSGGYTNSSFSSGFKKTFTDMKYSIPSSIRAVDINGDLLADQLYVGDMGGQIWRFDINNGSAVNSLVDGGVVADLAGSSAVDNRRFYHEPDVSIVKDSDGRKLAIAIGSGWQAHPLDQIVEDRFYLVNDPDWSSKPSDADSDGSLDYADYTESDLYDATDNHLGHVSGVNTDAEQVAAYIELGQKEGWYIRLTRPGEKVLASSLTAGGEVYFTTYEPVPSAISCNNSAGTPRLFHIQLANATPVVNYDGIGSDTELTRLDREVQLKTTSIPTTPQKLRIDGHDILCVGTECKKLESTETLIKTFWLEEN